MRALRDKATESEREQQVSHLADAIGERRGRDLLDAVATTERDEGWNTAVQYLIMAAQADYVTPASFGKVRTRVEPIKYREMVFELLSATGLEPVNFDTVDLLKSLEDKDSLAEATHSFGAHVQELSLEQIQNGDTLFFDLPMSNVQAFEELESTLESTRLGEIARLVLIQDGNTIDVTPLWYSEYGRRALSELGVKGTLLPTDQLDMVLSVIQVSPAISGQIQIQREEKTDLRPPVAPSNSLYADLLQATINQDLDTLSSFASRHSLPTLNVLLQNTVTQYHESPSSDNYRLVLECMKSHIAVRSIDSIIALEKLVRLDDPRVATPAINVLGNLYNHSSVLTLAETVCRGKKEWIIHPALNALESISKKCPETVPAIEGLLQSDCKNRVILKRFLGRISK